MSLHEQIKSDLTDAMRAKDEARLLVLRSLVTAFTNEAIARKITDDPLPDDFVLPVLKRAAKQRREAADQYKNGGRPELAETEEKELEIISTYLPEQMSHEEIKKVARVKKDELGVTDKKDMGKLIGAVAKELKGQAEGSTIKEVVESLF